MNAQTKRSVAALERVTVREIIVPVGSSGLRQARVERRRAASLSDSNKCAAAAPPFGRY